MATTEPHTEGTEPSRSETSQTESSQTELDIEQAMAVIEKGQQLAGHYPSKESLDSARRILTGELSPEDAEAEMHEALARIAAETHPQSRVS